MSTVKLAQVSELMRRLDAAKKPEEVKQIEAGLEAIETYLTKAGIFDVETMMPVNHARMTARWKLGQLLANVEREKGGRGKNSLTGLKSLWRGLAGVPQTGMLIQRLGAFPSAELEKLKATAATHPNPPERLLQFGRLVELAKPWWSRAKVAAAREDYEARAEEGGDIEDVQTLIDTGRKFNVIYADPPWSFKVYSGKGKQRSAERHYDTMTLADIKALGEKVEQLAADDAALFLWAVWPELPGALEVIASWGFEYKTAGFVWVKQISETNPDPFTGMGYWTRANSEPCLLATRGNPQRDARDVPQVIMAPIGKHSQKPDEARSRIERLLVGPYLELFGRDPVPGWTVRGNEVEKDLEAAE